MFQVPKKIRILSIDGGGIRGLIPAAYLNQLELKLQEKTKNPNVRLCDYFDLFCGTSTGAILGLCYNCPQKDGRPMTAKEALDIYYHDGNRVFLKTYKESILSLGGYIDNKYDHKGLEGLLDEKTSGKRLSQTIKPLFVTSFAGDLFHPYVFDSVRSRYESDYLMRDIGRATSAAPTYFHPHEFSSLDNKIHHKNMLDGGIFANNATGVAVTCATTLTFGKKNAPKPENMFVLSLGTGKLGKKMEAIPDYGGVIEWAGPLVNVMFSANTDSVDYTVKAYFQTGNNLSNYVRMQPPLYLTKCKANMDDLSQENLDALKELGEKIAHEGISKDKTTVNDYNFSNGGHHTIDDVARILIENHEDIERDHVIPIEMCSNKKVDSSYHHAYALPTFNY